MDRKKLLKQALLANGIFSALSGASLIILTEAIAAWLGVNAPLVLKVIGGGVILFALDIMLRLWRGKENPTWALYVSMSDLLWVIASFVLVLGFPGLLSVAGRWTVLAVAGVVLLFAVLQLAGLRRLALEQPGSIVREASSG